MKIKTKKYLNLLQLIEYAWDNEIENKEYPCDGFEDKTVIFNGMGWAEFSDEYSYNKTDFFIVTTEEEITEDTVFENLIEVREGLTGHMTWENATIDSEKDNSSQEFHAYIDGKYELIWTHEKGMVE